MQREVLSSVWLRPRGCRLCAAAVYSECIWATITPIYGTRRWDHTLIWLRSAEPSRTVEMDSSAERACTGPCKPALRYQSHLALLPAPACNININLLTTRMCTVATGSPTGGSSCSARREHWPVTNLLAELESSYAQSWKWSEHPWPRRRRRR